jgi:uncharacterized membrane protein
MKTRSLRSTIYFAGGLGLVASVFAMAEFLNASLSGVCTVNSFFSCALVNQSGLTSTLGIPDYLWGILGFLAILVLAGIAEKWPEDPRWAYGLTALTMGGIGLSLYFLYVELAEIHALCLVCASAYFFGWIAAIGALGLAVRTYRKTLADEPIGSPTPGNEPA